MSGVREKDEETAEVSRKEMTHITKGIGQTLREAFAQTERDLDDQFNALLRALDNSERGPAQ